MTGLMTGFAGAVAFLTRFPVARPADDGDALARSVPWFPLVGALVGLATGGVYWLADAVIAPLPAAALAVTAQLVLTGALHEDGLADVADSVGGRDVADRRRILHDPLHGTYGVVALVASVVLRVALVAHLAPADAAAALVAAHALGRGTAVALMSPAPAARRGLASGYTRHLTPGARVVGAVSAVGLAAVALTATGDPAVAPLAAALAAGAAMLLMAWGRRALDGMSGDLLGAVEQVSEIVVLVAVSAATDGR